MKPRTVSLPRQPPGRGPNGRPWCRGCWFRLGELVEVPRGRRAWCSTECVEDALVKQGDPNTVRRLVERRDRGVCAACGADAVLTEHVIWRLGSRPDRDGTARDAIRLIRRQWGRSPYNPASLWEADHVVPVAEGGGGCGLDGYRTLCRPCHRDETRALRRRLSRARTPQRSLDELAR